MNEMKGVVTTSLTIVIIFVLIIFWFKSFYTVEPWQVSFEKRFGQIQAGTNTEGLHFKNPFTDKVVITSIKDKKLETTATSASKDLQDVKTTIAVNYAINKDSVILLHQEIGDQQDVENVLIAPTIQESVKAATAKYTASELIQKRSEVRTAIVDNLKAKLETRWLRITEVNITNFGFSASFQASIEAKVKAEQEAIKAEKDLERVKFEAQQAIARSEAEAEKIRIQAQAVTSQWWAEYVQLQWIAAWDWRLPTYMLGDDTNLLMQMGN